MSNKRKADDAPSDEMDSKKPRLEVVHDGRWPAPPVDNYGWDKASLDEKDTINKTAALDKYLLLADDIEDCFFVEKQWKTRLRTYTTYQYCEEKIAQKAWAIHGGPEWLWHVLKETRAKHIAQQAKLGTHKPFRCPDAYRPNGRFSLDRPFPPCCDRYLAGNQIMKAAKDELPFWFWRACNVAVDHALYNGARPSGEPGSATRERVYAITAAQRFFRQHRARYSGRPYFPLHHADMEASKCGFLWALRGHLHFAPTILANLRGTAAWGPPKEGLLFHAATGNYEWDSKYLDELFDKLCGLIEALGLGKSGWDSVRWEIYHAYASAVDGGLRYDARSRTWTDPAGEWLDGQIESRSVQSTMRGRCAGGVKYNELLPVLDTTPSPGSSRASSGIPSPVRVPVAGPSSA